MRCEVYRNLHTGTFSVRKLNAGYRQGLVIGHPTRVVIDNATFAVQPAGRDKVRREGRKNVHAFVRGTLMEPWAGGEHLHQNGWMQPASYNPYENDTFVDKLTGHPVLEAPRVLLDIELGVWYSTFNNNNEVN